MHDHADENIDFHCLASGWNLGHVVMSVLAVGLWGLRLASGAAGLHSCPHP